MNYLKLFALLAVATMLPGVGIAHADDSDRLDRLEKQVEAFSAELEQRQYGDLFIPVGESAHGMGPAASKVYTSQGGLSIGGYGEALYQSFDDKTDSADFLRAILYFGYKYNEKWVLNTEIEIEHADEVYLEFGYLDYLHDPAFNFRAGMLLVPVGLVNELHEPNVFLSATRPTVENKIIPTTWRENGLGFFGDIGPVSYKTYLVNGLNGEAFGPDGLRGGRQKGSKAKAEDLAWVARVDYSPTPGVLLGGSFYTGSSGQDLDVSLDTTLYEGHLDWKWKGLDLRALAVKAEVDDTAELSRIIAREDLAEGEVLGADSTLDAVGEEMFGWYVQVGYDLLSLVDSGEKSLSPYIRYEEYNTQDKVPAGFSASGKYDVEILTTGINFKPLDEVVFKAEYQSIDNAAGSGEDQANLAMGYVF